MNVLYPASITSISADVIYNKICIISYSENLVNPCNLVCIYILKLG